MCFILGPYVFKVEGSLPWVHWWDERRQQQLFVSCLLCQLSSIQKSSILGVVKHGEWHIFIVRSSQLGYGACFQKGWPVLKLILLGRNLMEVISSKDQRKQSAGTVSALLSADRGRCSRNAFFDKKKFRVLASLYPSMGRSKFFIITLLYLSDASVDRICWRRICRDQFPGMTSTLIATLRILVHGCKGLRCLKLSIVSWSQSGTKIKKTKNKMCLF